ncbi:hypothetical protein M885DRAFT_522554 [Pelagophyceae sp. CCMP2097]|nr:hypothetical protein M885DRAFT_522554 [Pelagophyceae sp. CCMP2097]|eukprot:CAMPEP_0184097726 /NCGR_PEP_ID=MMETSP0974-20121125/10947_1 /TAXON_ID=483370 /ORGANISM="non described non described, Strain CCMP2097" /LENGTH=391 /DNA_ID=CAMNT_0026400595 /DNA_START=27 /DNA_END=1202 /DNA_ORIENTATION=+
MKLVFLALLAPAAAVRFGADGHGVFQAAGDPDHVLGADGHGLQNPVCCSQSAESGCSTLHPCLETPDKAESPGDVVKAFLSWIERFGKEYATVEEFAHRLAVFAANARLVWEHDAEVEGYSLSTDSPFADISAAEFAKRNTLFPKSKHVSAGSTHAVRFEAPPLKMDWRDSNAVTPVKDQGSCGSCWTFSTVVSIEGAHARKTGKLVSLSEQSLVDCVKQDDIDGTGDCCDGCNGGLMDNAFDFVINKQKGGIDTEEAYKYTGRDGACKFDANSVGATITNWTDVTAGDESALMDAIAHAGPVSVALDASKQWQMYSGGVMKPRSVFGCSADGGKADHGVAVVGYGTEDGADYWVVKNSWGPGWGEGGYMRLAKGVNACGVANFASYPISA